jgi:hypothetical protein
MGKNWISIHWRLNELSLTMIVKWADLISSTNVPEGPITVPRLNIFNIEA